MSRYQFSFPSTPMALKASDGVFAVLIANISIDDFQKHQLQVMLSELITNAFRHGNQQDESKKIDVELDISEEKIAIVVKDQGKGIDNIKGDGGGSTDLYSEGGRGIRLLRAFADSVEFFRDTNGMFCVRAVKNIGGLKMAANRSKSDTGKKEEA